MKKEGSKWQEVKSTRLVTLPGYKWKKWLASCSLTAILTFSSMVHSLSYNPPSHTPPLRPLSGRLAATVPLPPSPDSKCFRLLCSWSSVCVTGGDLYCTHTHTYSYQSHCSEVFPIMFFYCLHLCKTIPSLCYLLQLVGHGRSRGWKTLDYQPDTGSNFDTLHLGVKAILHNPYYNFFF